ncbi:MAG: hypothetical protein KKC79_04810 [Gammaproteobacteria bacterium]|nr:hypothetical protein [Gammaproteobacteria bacterium]MBU1441875.1 hypothetical protein [Gammaproteobacteria bacterium]MBU2286641.1 hypothetical protein [Gammaproteobacteria bacterium]MBU2407955.1 hypothetical protein [Gammaproteobacteria bacterium]
MKRIVCLAPLLALLAACTTPPNGAPVAGGAAATPPAQAGAMPPPPSAPVPSADMAHSQVGKAEVMKVLTETMKPWWSPVQQGLMLYLGYYSAASAMCDTLEIDKAKVDTLVRTKFLQPQGSRPKSKGPATPSELGFRKDVFLMHLGMVTGAVMGSHRADIPGFCADATALKVKVPGASNLFKTN